MEVQEIANLKDEELDKLQEELEAKENITEEAEVIVTAPTVVKEEKPAETPAVKEEKPAEKPVTTETPADDKVEKPAEEPAPAPAEEDDPYKDLSPEDLKKALKEKESIVKKQEKRIVDKDEFIEKLKFEKRDTRQRLVERIKSLEKDKDTFVASKPTKDELNDNFRADPIGTQEKIEQIKTKEKVLNEELIEAYKEEKRMYNKDIIEKIDGEFDTLVDDMGNVLKATGKFSDEQIDRFKKDPYLENIDVLLDLRKNAIKNRELKNKENAINEDDNPQAKDKKPVVNTEDTNKKIEENKKTDLANKINKANAARPVLRGSNSSGETRVSSIPKVNGNYDLSEMSIEELEALDNKLEAEEFKK